MVIPLVTSGEEVDALPLITDAILILHPRTRVKTLFVREGEYAWKPIAASRDDRAIEAATRLLR